VQRYFERVVLALKAQGSVVHAIFVQHPAAFSRRAAETLIHWFRLVFHWDGGMLEQKRSRRNTFLEKSALKKKEAELSRFSRPISLYCASAR
jgi:hypothetical protein